MIFSEFVSDNFDSERIEGDGGLETGFAAG